MRTLDTRTEQFLLGRPLRASIPAAVREAFAGRRVLITGGGGSVGSELARQLLACRPESIVVFDHAEYLLFRALARLHDRSDGVTLVPVLGDVSRPEDLESACRAHRPEFVFHAAACKHVTIAEQCIVAAARSNVLGAVYAARAARAVNARFILISTDKAAMPHSVMGATKRLAELSVLDGRSDAIAVRFGNVLGSSGSVVEVLMDAARQGRPLTVTDPGATRFFMTAAEAASLVLKAALSGRPGDVFWLDMGSPLKLMDLVERILDVVTPSGSPRPPISIIGLRPGEKRNEELTTRDLAMEATDDPAIWRARQTSAPASLAAALEQLQRACKAGDARRALLVLQRTVPDYTPSPQAFAAADRTSLGIGDALWQAAIAAQTSPGALRRLA